NGVRAALRWLVRRLRGTPRRGGASGEPAALSMCLRTGPRETVGGLWLARFSPSSEFLSFCENSWILLATDGRFDFSLRSVRFKSSGFPDRDHAWNCRASTLLRGCESVKKYSSLARVANHVSIAFLIWPHATLGGAKAPAATTPGRNSANGTS